MPETFTVNHLHLVSFAVILLVVIMLYGELPIGDGFQLVLVFKSMDGEEDPRSRYDAA